MATQAQGWLNILTEGLWDSFGGEHFTNLENESKIVLNNLLCRSASLQTDCMVDCMEHSAQN